LKFPEDKDMQRKEKVSYQAMDLINNILQEKEHRLCSMKYRQNDYQHQKRVTGQYLPTRAHKQAQDFQGHYVYPDDAEDIKAHPFFQGLSWDRLHLSRPPFVPDVKGRDDTKYFDDEDEISDVEDVSSCSFVNKAGDPKVEHGKTVAARPLQVDGAEGARDANIQPIIAAELKGQVVEAVDGKEGILVKVKEKKRPRDRVLRDKEVARKVLEIRKKGAFMGYTYRRPKNMVREEERGRMSVSRRDGMISGS
jgi:hypothetical protein